ncbi:MAG: hypothetical protein GF383_01470 [Candidatus Lokiarchaeota archaeon]|nr:hypothetical protein [Candidatus Lokiarchaeota archaeon]MBD3337933.1 hypothetical protein [Candidatus Lokiarchaeota archaeon]
MLAHSITLKVFSEFEEDADEIKSTLENLIPFDLKKEKVDLRQKSVFGFNQKKIKIFQVNLTKKRQVRLFLQRLNKSLTSEEKSKIIQELSNRLDEELNLFLRFDKKELIENNKFLLTDHGNCFHLKINIAAFPKKRNIAMEQINSIFY